MFAELFRDCFLCHHSAGGRADGLTHPLCQSRGLGPSRGYTYLVDANRPGRILYLAGQLGTDTTGKVVSADFREQATQAYENIKTALASVGAKFEDVVKMNVYLTDIRAQLPIHREIREKYVNKAAPPASTTIEISRLAREGGLIEVDVTAVLAPR